MTNCFLDRLKELHIKLGNKSFKNDSQTSPTHSTLIPDHCLACSDDSSGKYVDTQGCYLELRSSSPSQAPSPQVPKRDTTLQSEILYVCRTSVLYDEDIEYINALASNSLSPYQRALLRNAQQLSCQPMLYIEKDSFGSHYDICGIAETLLQRTPEA